MQLAAPKGRVHHLRLWRRTICRRDFANGMILVNLGAGTSAPIALGGTYAYATGTLATASSSLCPASYPGTLPLTHVSSVTLGATSAYILHWPCA